jgi:hypothetical protein
MGEEGRGGGLRGKKGREEEGGNSHQNILTF